jgi:hypothetical protein
MATAKRVAKRKDYIARGAALSYMLMVYSWFKYVSGNLSPGYSKAVFVGALLGTALTILILILRDRLPAVKFDQPFYGGKVFLFTTRMIAYFFPILSLL